MTRRQGIVLGAGLAGVIAIAGWGVYPWLWEANTERAARESKSGESSVAADIPVWAEAVERVGLANLHRVTPTLYRGAQPEEAGFEELKKLGVKMVINLRSFHSDRRMLGGTGLDYAHIYMKAWHPEDEDVVKFLKLATDPANQPVFVHCQHGADRTGICCAAYRIVVQGWTKEQAIKEMTEGGFGFHPVWQDLVDYIRKLDVRKMRREIGLPSES